MRARSWERNKMEAKIEDMEYKLGSVIKCIERRMSCTEATSHLVVPRLHRCPRISLFILPVQQHLALKQPKSHCEVRSERERKGVRECVNDRQQRDAVIQRQWKRQWDFVRECSGAVITAELGPFKWHPSPNHISHVATKATPHLVHSIPYRDGNGTLGSMILLANKKKKKNGHLLTMCPHLQCVIKDSDSTHMQKKL